MEQQIENLLPVAGEWVADLEGVLGAFEDEDREQMAKDGIKDEETQDSLLLVVQVKAVWDLYNRLLAQVEEPDARASIKACIEKSAPAPIPAPDEDEEDEDGEEVATPAAPRVSPPAAPRLAQVAPIAPKIKN
jgi:hypothetical protein